MSMEQTFCEEDSEGKEVENHFYDMSTLSENSGTVVSSKYYLTDESCWQQETFDGFFEQALALAVKLEERRGRAKRLKSENRSRRMRFYNDS